MNATTHAPSTPTATKHAPTVAIPLAAWSIAMVCLERHLNDTAAECTTTDPHRPQATQDWLTARHKDAQTARDLMSTEVHRLDEGQ